MIAKIAIVFLAPIIAMVFTTMCGFALFFFTYTLLGIDSPASFFVQYLGCLVAGAISAFLLLRKAWPRSARKEAGEEQTTSGRV
jgi:drug/metabolite transporter (DMT)-like permease